MEADPLNSSLNIPSKHPIYNNNQLSPADLKNWLSNTLPFDVDPTKCHLAFGRSAIPNLVSELLDGSVSRQQRALVFLSDLFHNPEHIAQGLQERVVPKLVKLLSEEDLTIKQKSTECLATISGIAAGRTSIVNCNAPLALSKLFDDEDLVVRKNIHETFYRVTLNHEGKSPWMPKDALDCNAMETFTALVKLEMVTEVKVAASRCIMALSFYPAGKRKACELDTVSCLIRLLSDRKSQVRAAAAGALMSITIDCDAKRMMVRENAIQTLITLLDDKNESVLLNTIKTITNCAEDYRGRFQLHSCLKKLEAMKELENQQIVEASKRAIQVITWRP
ncbi:Radial spoke head 14 [Nowakowskiella sp. JEL0407]|nr:Radial spoke head 14 [Nowakowskiella sp. JEL0407]